eukprot:1149343-Pelagomonas_calceolata.AAC.3
MYLLWTRDRTPTSLSILSAVAMEVSGGWPIWEAIMPPPPPDQETWPSSGAKPSWVTIRRAMRVTCTNQQGFDFNRQGGVGTALGTAQGQSPARSQTGERCR